MVKFFILGLALIGIGITMLVNPRLVYELTESWKHDGGVYEPSRRYVWNTRFGGVMCTLAGILGLIVPFIS